MSVLRIAGLRVKVAVVEILRGVDLEVRSGGSTSIRPSMVVGQAAAAIFASAIRSCRMGRSSQRVGAPAPVHAAELAFAASAGDLDIPLK